MMDSLAAYKRIAKHERRHGLNILTDWSQLPLDDAVDNHGGSDIKVNAEFDVKIFDAGEIMRATLDDVSMKKIKAYLTRKIPEDSFHKISHLHHALANPKIIIVPEGSIGRMEISIIAQAYSFTEAIIVVGKDSQLEIVEQLKDNDATSTFISYFSHIIISDNSSVRHCVINRAGKVAYYADSSYELGADARLELVTLDISKGTLIRDSSIRLLGDNSDANVKNIYYCTEYNYDIYTTIEHAGRNTRSLMNSRGALSSSKAISRGMIRILPGASGADGYQKSDALLLDSSARAISMPELEIDNEQVKCSHGSSITRLDEDKLFYLQSRGMPRELARKKLIEGFYHDALSGTEALEPMLESIGEKDD